MGPGRSPLRFGVVCAAGALAAIASCRDPTEVTLVLTTDVPCSGLKETAIVVGSAADVETKSPVAVTSACSATGSGDSTIGTFVVIPDSGGSSAPFAVRIVSAVDKMTAADCTPADNYSGCIVARRELSFVPHTPLTLPIVIRLDCLDVACVPGETCVHGTCKSDQVPQCSLACGESTLPPVDGGGNVSGEDAAPEAQGAETGSSSGGSSSSGASVEDAPADMTVPTGPDAAEEAEASSRDVTVVEAAPEASFDAPADARPDATIDSGFDAPADVGSDVVDAVASDGMPPADAGPGACVDAGTTTGVACGSGRCSPGQVCCVDVTGGSTVTEQCTTPGGCNVNATGNDFYSSMACRSVGDCMAGQVCCAVGNPGNPVGGSFLTSCVTSCPSTFAQRAECQGNCECAATICKAITCVGVPLNTCGGVCP